MGIAMLKDDDFHAILLDEIIREEGLSVKSIETNDPRKVSEFRYPSMEDKKILLVDTENHEVSLELYGANRNSYKIIERVPRYQTAHPDFEKMPLYIDYEDRMEFFEERLMDSNLRFESREVESILLKNLVRTPISYRQLQTLEESLPYGEPVTVTHLEDMYGEIDFYNLTQVLVDAIMGRYKRKTIKEMQYFTEYKGFSPRWIGTKLKETAVELDYFYLLKGKGILVTPKRLEDVRERLQVSNMHVPIEFPSIRDQRVYLNTIRDVPYREAKRKIDMALQDTPIVDEVSLYSVLMDLRREDEDG